MFYQGFFLGALMDDKNEKQLSSFFFKAKKMKISKKLSIAKS